MIELQNVFTAMLPGTYIFEWKDATLKDQFKVLSLKQGECFRFPTHIRDSAGSITIVMDN